MVANGDGRALGHQQAGGRFAHNLTMSNHDHFHALQIATRLFEQFDRRCRCTGRQGNIIINDVTDECRVHTLDIFEGMDCALQ